MFLIIFSGELGEFCLNNSNLPGEELPNQAFVLDYVIFDSTDPDTLIDYEDPEDQFRVVITTRNLLKFSLHFELVLQSDGTYKLM